MIYKSHLVTDMRGSVAGITYSKNRYGLTGRGKVTPVNPSSGYQEFQRALLGQAVYGFKNLTEAQQIAWDNFAAGTPWKNKLGQDVFLTGQAMYIGQRTAGISALPSADPANYDDCPCTPGLLPAPFVEYGCCANPTVGTIVTVTNMHDTENMDFVVRISPAWNQSRTYYNGPYRTSMTIFLATVAAGASDDAEFCPLCLGRYFFEIRGFSAVARNNMTSLVRGYHDVCTDPV